MNQASVRPAAFLRSALFAFALAAFVLPAGLAAGGEVVSDEEVTRYADDLFARTYAADAPGAAVLISRGGKVLLRKGYGMADLEMGVAIDPGMVFQLGSITKQFTGTAILMLEERGKLSVADDVTKYLPDYPTHGETITIHHLLTHVSGIPSYTDLAEWLPRVREDMTVEQVIELFKDKPLEFEPGETWRYNNSAYILLGAVIEKVSGKTYEDFVEQEIFAPLGMKRSYYGHQNEVIPGRVEGYDKVEDGYAHAEYLSLTQPYAAGSLLSTVDDLALWASSGESLLGEESVARLYTPATLASGRSTKYAYGIGVAEEGGVRILEHGGGIFGFATDLLRIPAEELVVVVLSNNPGQSPGPMALAYRVARKALGQPLEERRSVSLDSALLDEYVGVYRFDEETTRAIFREGEQLFAQRNGSEKFAILASAPDEFFYADPEGSPSRLRFVRDDAGQVAALDFLVRFGPDSTGVKTDEPLPVERQAAQVDPALFAAYVGTYEMAPGLHLTITREGDQLEAQLTGQPAFDIFPASERRFFLKVVPAEVEFTPPVDGKSAGLTLYQGGQEMPGRRIR